jgi:DDE superfamily endonuclease
MGTVKDNPRGQSGPRTPFEKKRTEELRYNITTDSILLYEDEKGPVAAKTYGGTSWSSVQSKASKAQKINGLLNVLGVCDHTNNQMWTHGYQRKTGTQFLDFIKRADQKHNDSIRQVFLVLDNASTHKPNKVKQTMAKCYPRIHPVFLPPDHLSST